MGWFIGGLLFLVLGYFAYGRVIERILGPRRRPNWPTASTTFRFRSGRTCSSSF